MKKVDKNNIEHIDGQLSIFDIQITEKPKSFIKKAEMAIENGVLVTEKPTLDTKIISTDKKKENEKTENPSKLTDKQQQYLDKNRVMENENLSRIILHAKGGITVEIKESGTFISHYINSEGQKQFDYPSKSSLMPWDRVYYYNPIFKNEITQIQENKLQKLLETRKDIKKVIHRKGDENIILELEEGVLSVNPIGWELPFESMDHVECSEDEIYFIPGKEVKEELTKNVDIVAKVGDYVQVDNGEEIIEGTLFSEYNSGHTFNIIYDNGTKHTAIPRVAILKILKSA